MIAVKYILMEIYGVGPLSEILQYILAIDLKEGKSLNVFLELILSF